MQTKQWSLRLDPDTRKLLDTLAKEMQRSRANVIKVLIHERAAQSPTTRKNKRATARQQAAAQ